VAVGTGHSHDHDGEHGAAAAFDPTLVRWLTITAVALGIATLVGIVALWPGDRDRTDIGSFGVSRTSYAATVTAVEEFACPGAVDLDPNSDGLDALDDQDDGDRTPSRCATLSEETQWIRVLGGDLDFTGLLLAGMILGALGALDDMTVTQSSAVAELKTADPTLGPVELYRRAIRIGRDHVASTVNTLALAYAGASLPLLLVFLSSEQTIGRVLTSEIVATEIVRTLVGSIGLVASVPLTTALAARVVGGRRTPRRSPTDAGRDAGLDPNLDGADGAGW
jgi:hypothetical protein